MQQPSSGEATGAEGSLHSATQNHRTSAPNTNQLASPKPQQVNPKPRHVLFVPSLGLTIGFPWLPILQGNKKGIRGKPCMAKSGDVSMEHGRKVGWGAKHGVSPFGEFGILVLSMDEILHHPRNPGMMMPLQITANNGFPWIQSGAGCRPSTIPLYFRATF